MPAPPHAASSISYADLLALTPETLEVLGQVRKDEQKAEESRGK